jgi:hypothetical protein
VEPHAISSALITRLTYYGPDGCKRVRRRRLHTVREKKLVIPDRQRQVPLRLCYSLLPGLRPSFYGFLATLVAGHVCAGRARTYSFDVLGWSTSRAKDAIPAVSRSRATLLDSPFPLRAVEDQAHLPCPFRAIIRACSTSTRAAYSAMWTSMAGRRIRSCCSEARACIRDTYGLFEHAFSTVPVWSTESDGTYVLQKEQVRREPTWCQPVRRGARCRSGVLLKRENNGTAMENRTVRPQKKRRRNATTQLCGEEETNARVG